MEYEDGHSQFCAYHVDMNDDIIKKLNIIRDVVITAIENTDTTENNKNDENNETIENNEYTQNTITNGNHFASGLMQLIRYGYQDFYLTEKKTNPLDLLFEVSYEMLQSELFLHKQYEKN